MTDAEYRAAPGLSNSAMKDLAVSPLRYWHRHLNPDAPVIEPSAEMQMGSAVHCAVLEPAEFDNRYVCEFIPPDDVLDTMDDLREFIRSKGKIPKGTRKDEVIAQVQFIDPTAPILAVLVPKHEAMHAGKNIFKADDWRRIAGMSKALLDEPHVQRILAGAKTEVVIFGKDQETGTALKGKLDVWQDDYTADIKTFSAREGQSIDQCVGREILYRSYYRQAYFYSLLRGWPDFNGPFIMPFVESEEPHEVRIRELSAGDNLYWKRAALEVRNLIRLYAECMEHFGPDKPWRYAQDVVPLRDEEMPGMGW